MKFTETELRGAVIVDPDCIGDNRGWFMETYNENKFHDANLYYDFVQDNQSFSSQKGILRGVHFQKNPMAQAKLVRCTKGGILDIAVDLRRGSDTYLKHVAVELTENNHRELMIPRGFGHGFVTLTDDVMVQYKVDNLYSKDCDRSIRYNDPSMSIEWGVNDPIMSQKDINAPLLSDSDVDFTIKVLVTGVKGQLGHDVMKRLNRSNYECIGVDIDDFDITDYNAVATFIKRYNPDVVVHCSAYTAVDKAEENQKLCYQVNVVGSENIAKVCGEIGAKMVYLSTDYVYNGMGDRPHKTTDEAAPLSTYGRTKLQGEEACRKYTDRLFVIRTSWVFGINGGNFVKTMLRLAATNDSVRVVNDQIGSPTYTPDLADFIFYIINTDKYGIYHCSNEGYCSWHEFAKAIFEYNGVNINLIGIPTSDYKTLAIRPINSRLSKECLIDCGYGIMPDWRDALQRYLAELKESHQ